MNRFENKVVIITGSSAGIGQAAALDFAKEGASVTIHGRSTDGIQKTIDLLTKNGVPEKSIQTVQGSIEDEATCHAIIDKTIEKFGKIDVLVNNAGCACKANTDVRSLENFDYLMKVNVRSVILLTELAIPYLEKTRGNIVNVGSATSMKTTPYIAFYGMSKAALDHFCRNYAVMLAPKGIRVNNLNPGPLDTEFHERRGATKEEVEKMKNWATQAIPLRRFGHAEEMSRALLFLASEATYTTGTIMLCDGGSLVYAPVPQKTE